MKYLRGAVYSVLEQPYEKTEIIIVDDGSTDGSYELCNTLAGQNNRIHVIHQMNAGVSAARNAGIEYVYKLAEGQDAGEKSYVAFLDSDDAWFSHVISEQDNALIERGYDLIGFQSCDCNADMSRRRVSHELKAGVYRGGADSVWIHAYQGFFAMWYRVGFLKEYDLKFQLQPFSEDVVFRMQALYLADDVYLENRMFYMYRINPASAFRTRSHDIEFYVPIIEGWLQSDASMKKWENGQRGVMIQGKSLAKHYIVQMTAEHYQYGGTKIELEKAFRERPVWAKLMNDEMVGVQYTQQWNAIMSHQARFIMKNRMKGTLRRGIRLFFSLPGIRQTKNMVFRVKMTR